MGKITLYSLLLTFFLILVLWFSPIFYLKSIDITSKPLFVELNDCQRSLDTLVGKHLLAIYFLNLINKQLHYFPEIKSFSIVFDSINALQVSLTERHPWISSIIDGKTVFIDEEGYLLTYNQTSNKVLDHDIFIIKGFLKNDLSQTTLSSLMLKQLQDYVAVFECYLPNHNLFLEHVHDELWQLILDDSIVVLLGDLANLENKFERVNYFLTQLSPQDYNNLDYIDSRIDNKLLVKYASK